MTDTLTETALSIMRDKAATTTAPDLPDPIRAALNASAHEMVNEMWNLMKIGDEFDRVIHAEIGGEECTTFPDMLRDCEAKARRIGFLALQTRTHVTALITALTGDASTGEPQP